MLAPPEFFTGLVDDAAFFPPGDLPMERAVPAHREHLDSAYGSIVGTFVAPDRELPTLGRLVDAASEPLRTSIVVTGGAGAIEPAVRWAEQTAGINLVGLEVAVRESADGADLTHNTLRIVTALRGLVDDDLPVWVELPAVAAAEAEPTPSWLAALDEVAGAGLQAKLRTGGLDAAAFPTPQQLASAIEAMLDRELTFKCTAGLHNAVRHHADDGFDHHGFLNVLLAVRASLDGASSSDVAAILEERDAEAISTRIQACSAGEAASVRRVFASFGSCSIIEPVQDLRSLRLIPGDSGLEGGQA